MIVIFASPATRGFLSPFLSLSCLVSSRRKKTAGTRVYKSTGREFIALVFQVEQWKAEASNSERQRHRMEEAYANLQNQLQRLQGADRRAAELQTKYSSLEKSNWELSEKVRAT